MNQKLGTSTSSKYNRYVSPYPEPDPAELAQLQQEQFEVPPEAMPNYDEIVTEDDTPMDNLFVEKQQRCFTEPLYSSWEGPGEGRSFLAMANVGVFSTPREPALVPDGALGLDVQLGEDLLEKENRSWFIWNFGKPPDVVIEIVSDKRGGEATHKRVGYARMGIPYYVIFDPLERLESGVLQAFGLNQGTYEPIDPSWLPKVGLGLKLWEGVYEGHHARWLRWCDRDGRVIPSGSERIAQERQRAEQERQRAEQVLQEVEQERERIRRLEAQLRAHGIDPSA
jgi:hypothetical protein